MAEDYIARLAAQRREEAPRHEQQIQCVAHVERHDVGRLHGLDSGALALHGSDAERRDAQHQAIVASIADAYNAGSAEAAHIGRLGAVFAAALENLQRAFDAAQTSTRLAEGVCGDYMHAKGGGESAEAKLHTRNEPPIDRQRTVVVEHEVLEAQRAEPRYRQVHASARPVPGGRRARRPASTSSRAAGAQTWSGRGRRPR